ncbi:hypothetical protein BLNAU_3852 [Blattamonas nauphoetae]|uniref:Uncharacterized protein n=1 Tax=Blattamonas nauphoetae TaxID=2049346 RepID=A0ABQ9YBV4_9EUKA|nr:hypothetical protein BLNAU_3852 [Blattamonas nauphoetae]
MSIGTNESGDSSMTAEQSGQKGDLSPSALNSPPSWNLSKIQSLLEVLECDDDAIVVETLRQLQKEASDADLQIGLGADLKVYTQISLTTNNCSWLDAHQQVIVVLTADFHQHLAFINACVKFTITDLLIHPPGSPLRIHNSFTNQASHRCPGHSLPIFLHLDDPLVSYTPQSILIRNQSPPLMADNCYPPERRTMKPGWQ